MKEKTASKELSTTSKAHHFTTVEEVIAVTNTQLEDLLYIGKKNSGHNYRSDFTFKTKEEAKILIKENQAIISSKDKTSDFFVYNERTKELLPFKKDDYLLYDRGYLTFDGTNYISYDDNGNEI